MPGPFRHYLESWKQIQRKDDPKPTDFELILLFPTAAGIPGVVCVLKKGLDGAVSQFPWHCHRESLLQRELDLQNLQCD